MFLYSLFDALSTSNSNYSFCQNFHKPWTLRRRLNKVTLHTGPFGLWISREYSVPHLMSCNSSPGLYAPPSIPQLLLDTLFIPTLLSITLGESACSSPEFSKSRNWTHVQFLDVKWRRTHFNFSLLGPQEFTFGVLACYKLCLDLNFCFQIKNKFSYCMYFEHLQFEQEW